MKFSMNEVTKMNVSSGEKKNRNGIIIKSIIFIFIASLFWFFISNIRGTVAYFTNNASSEIYTVDFSNLSN